MSPSHLHIRLEVFVKEFSERRVASCKHSLNLQLLVTKRLLSVQAILCRYNEESEKHTALSLSKEHNPTQYDERMRIQKAGGNVR